MHCKAKNFRNSPSPLCFPFCFSSLPTDAWGTTSPDFYVENWVHLAIDPSCPLPPTWMWSWESMFSHQAPLWQWGEGAPSPLGLSAAHTPQVWSWHTPPGQGGGGVDPLPTDRGQMFQTWPQQVSKVFSFRKTTWATALLPEDAGRPLPWDLSSPFTQYWPLDFCLISWLPGIHRA